MKIIKNSLRIIVLLLALLVLAVFIVASSLRKGAVPELNGEQQIAGLNGDVRVIRDERGVPHIYATNAHDLYLVTGYISAQERMWQMDLIRRATRGRLSEIFGPDYIETDHFLRLLNMTAKSETVLEKEDPEILAAMQSYCDGVNAWIGERGKKLPAEFRILGYAPEPWSLTDIANIIGYMGWELAKDNLTNELRNYRLVQRLGEEKGSSLLPGWDLDDEVVFPGFTLDAEDIDSAVSFIASLDRAEKIGAISFSGSNNWAVSGARSETGKPILSNDMHLGLSIPGYWIQVHQVIPGELNVTGVMVPGQPFIVAGHNEKIAWGITNLMVDDIDLFVETVDSSGRYLFNGEWLPMTSREEVIIVKGGLPETRVITSSHRGPVISDLRGIDDAVMTMRWSGYDYSDEVKAVYLLDRAGNWEAFRSAISNFRSVSQNFAYADAEGNIGINTGGGIPVRKGNGLLPRSGETDEYDWKGYVPFEMLPSSYNPENGFVSSANEQTVTADYPYYIAGDFATPWRIIRIRQMAAEKQILGIDDFRRMITDNHSAYAAKMTPMILEAAKGITSTDEGLQKAIDLLEAWDYKMDASLAAPTIFEFTRAGLARNILSDELGDLYGGVLGKQHDHYLFRILHEGADGWVDNTGTAETETLDDMMVLSLRNAVDTLTSRYGTDTDNWRWGEIHSITLEHPMGSVKMVERLLRLNSKKYSVGGSYHTVEPYSFGPDFSSDHGASERHIFNTADWDKSLTVIPTGTSGNPGSPFYLSQTEAYINNEFFAEPFTDAAVVAAKKFEMIFRPSAGR
jgi:penicillin amidase